MDVSQADAILNVRSNSFNVVFGRIKKCQSLKTANCLQNAFQQNVRITIISTEKHDYSTTVAVKYFQVKLRCPAYAQGANFHCIKLCKVQII